jgi:hypothetical protein
MELVGMAGPAHVVHNLAGAAGGKVPFAPEATTWLASAGMSGIFGLILGFSADPDCQLCRRAVLADDQKAVRQADPIPRRGVMGQIVMHLA